MDRATTVEEYLAALPGDRRAELEHLRATVLAAADEADEAGAAAETIAYDMPALRLNGRFLVSYGAYRSHLSLFPASGAVREALGEALAPYFRGKGTLRFRAGEPIPEDLVRRVVAVRLAEVAAQDRD